MNMDFIPRILAGRPPRLQSLAGFTAEGAPLLDGDSGPLRSALVLGGVGAGELREAYAAGEQVLVVEVDGQPIVLGVAHAVPRDDRAVISVTGEQVVIAAQRELVLRCGDASLTLTKAGKVLVKGSYVSTQAEGENRIKGGSVRIN